MTGAAQLLGTSLGDDELELVAESIPHIAWLKRANGRAHYLNRRGAEFFGIAPEASYGWSFLDLVHPDDVSTVRRAWRRVLHDGSDYATDIRMRRADSRYRWMASRASAVHDADGGVVHWIGTLTDIDDQKGLEQELRRSQQETLEALTLLDTLQSKAPVGFLFVDTDFRYVRVNEEAAAINGVPVAEHLGRRVSEVVPALWPEIEPAYRRVLQWRKPVVNVEMTGETAAEPGTLRSWLVSFYPVLVHAEILGIGVVIVDITERKQAEAAQAALTHAAVGAIAATVEARDPYTAGHQRRVADIAVAIAGDLGLDPDTIEGIELAASIHDIGKIGIPSEILARPGRLSPVEMELVQGHSHAGAEILNGINFPWPIQAMVAQHHERFDGSGYPDGLRGKDIDIGARILAVADTFEAMASHRPYRPAKGVDAAAAEIRRGRGSLYDPDVVDACLRLLEEGLLNLPS